MKAFLLKWFTGYRFWSVLGTFNLFILIVNLVFPFMSEITVASTILLMWLSLGISEILVAINGKKSE